MLLAYIDERVCLIIVIWNRNNCFSFVLPSAASSEYQAHTLSVSVPFVSYMCPEGANVTMECEQSGALAHPADHLQHVWLFTPHMDQRCHERLHKPNALYKAQSTSFSVTLLDVSQASQGRYCCLALDFLQDSKHKPSLQQRAHSHILLTITPRKKDCLSSPPAVPPCY